MALESIASVATPSIAAPVTTQPVVSPQAPAGGVATIGTDPDSVVVTLSETLPAPERREHSGTDSQIPANLPETETENAGLSREDLDNILTSNISVRLAYDGLGSRSYIEIYNTSNNLIILRSPSERFVELITRQLQQ